MSVCLRSHVCSNMRSIPKRAFVAMERGFTLFGGVGLTLGNDEEVKPTKQETKPTEEEAKLTEEETETIDEL